MGLVGGGEVVHGEAPQWLGRPWFLYAACRMQECGANEQRHCLTLAFFDGLSHAEIALQVDKPLGTVKSWVRRALAAMRPALAEHAAAEPTRASAR